uniref:PAX-interacting protein 1 n=1 Tax=Romanomermis culicivorax TaxID=13658 RepID=A0A915KCG0_ROMCU
MAQVRMTHNVVSVPPHPQQQNLNTTNNGQSMVTPGAAPPTPASPQNPIPQQHHGRPNVPQMYIIGGSGPINVHQHIRSSNPSVPRSPAFVSPPCSVNNGIQQMVNASQVNNTPSHPNINTYQQQQPQPLHRTVVVTEPPPQQQQQHDWRVCIVQYGGEVENSYTARCTHIVCDSLRNSIAQQAIKENKRCVSAQWLNDCVQLKRMQPPWKIVHFPSHYGDNKPCKNKIFAASGFDVNERLCIRQMTAAVGARYTSYLSKHNTLLLAKCLDGEKVAKAIEWKIPIVNVQWLYELFLGQQGALQSLNNPRYHQFLTKEALQMVNIDLFRIDPNSAPIPVLMGAWRSPIQVTPECWKNASERKQKLEDDVKLFPYKKLRLSPGPEEEDIRSKRNVQSMSFENAQPRIAFTGFYSLEVENLAKKALWLGAIVESNVRECTHLVTPDLKRTKKVLEALSLGRLIVLPAWIKQSYKQQRLLDCLEFIVKDEGNEKFFGFNVKLSIFKARQKPLFEEIVFYLTPSVQPSPTILTDLIQTSGGTILQQKPSINKIMDFQQNSIQLAIITCDNDIHLCQTWIEFGFPIHSAEFVLTGILRQEIDFQSYRIEPKSLQSSVLSILDCNMNNNNNPIINASSKILNANVNNIQIVQHII